MSGVSKIDIYETSEQLLKLMKQQKKRSRLRTTTRQQSQAYSKGKRSKAASICDELKTTNSQGFQGSLFVLIFFALASSESRNGTSLRRFRRCITPYCTSLHVRFNYPLNLASLCPVPFHDNCGGAIALHLNCIKRSCEFG